MGMKKKQVKKPRNMIAKDLMSAKYHQRVVVMATLYRRKDKHPNKFSVEV
jgi:hypothetical protein